MGTVTYPHGGVDRRLSLDFVSVRPQIDLEKDLAKRFLVSWTPGFLFLDGLENIHYRAFGFHPPEMFEHLLDLGRGIVEFNQGRFNGAINAFTAVTEDDHPTPLQPEALYWLGVARYKSGDKDGMSRSWNQLLGEHPDSVWALKAGFIREKAAQGARRG
jgi:hypothetical protein